MLSRRGEVTLRAQKKTPAVHEDDEVLLAFHRNVRQGSAAAATTAALLAATLLTATLLLAARLTARFWLAANGLRSTARGWGSTRSGTRCRSCITAGSGSRFAAGSGSRFAAGSGSRFAANRSSSTANRGGLATNGLAALVTALETGVRLRSRENNSGHNSDHNQLTKLHLIFSCHGNVTTGGTYHQNE